MTTPAAASVPGQYATDTPQRRILAAAIPVLVERGFPDTRVADVAKQAGVSPGLVMYYFKSRYGLLTTALRFAEDIFYDDVRQRLDTIEHAGNRLAELIRLAFRPENGTEVPGSWLLWFDLWQQAVRHPELRREREQLDRRWRDIIADIVRQGQATGCFRSTDADDFAVMLSAMSDGLAVPLSLGDAEVGHERALTLCMRLCSHELGENWLDDPADTEPQH